ncbi:MAG: hypothetical protein U9R74_05960 [Pseudomonadota bacterium]|nr:hypothetical protein [Pseudomonadota bacterium]
MDFVQMIFQGLSGRTADKASGGGACNDLTRAVERVVDEVSANLRSIPRYARVLTGPVSLTFQYIDEVVEKTPGAFPCRRSAFVEDPRINAFFASAQHLQEVFSQSEEVRQVFEKKPDAAECWGLLCMRKEERTKLGMAAVDGAIRRDVMQTAVNFTDHQIVSPGTTESEARCALKCCIFNSLLADIRSKVTSARTRSGELGTRLRALQGRLRRLENGGNAGSTRSELREEIAAVERELATVEPRLETNDDLLQFLADTLSDPGKFIRMQTRSLRLNRMGTRIEGDSSEPGYDLDVSEISVASREPRVSAMVRFPRAELLPREDFLKKANLFLSM